MFWRLGLLEGPSPIKHLLQFKGALTGAKGLHAKKESEGLYVISFEKLQVFISEVRKRYLDNPYHR